MEERLDKILVKRGLVSTRIRAEKVIEEIGIKVNGKLIQKPGKKFPEDCTIEMVAEELPWVSIDALKLEAALKTWKINIKNGIFMDLGCSTGGFTEYLIENGAQKVYAQDNSKNSLHPKLQEHISILNLNGVPIREITKSEIPDEIDGCVINAPFLPMDKIFPFVRSFISQNGFVIALLKPQFEADKEFLKHDGTAKSNNVFQNMREKICKTGELSHFEFIAAIESPVLGNNGQKEMIVFFRKK